MAKVTLTHLRCEYQSNPLGLEDASPRLSWRLEASDRGVSQSAYQVMVASTEALLAADQADVWDSGRVKSSQNVHVDYAGRKLASRRRYYWKVRIWDQAGQGSPWSEMAFWEMGLTGRGDWKAQWIGGNFPSDPANSIRCPYLRKGFALGGQVANARVYVSAMGLYELWINGRRVGDDYFTPGWTDYTLRVQYQTYDVTGLLQSGANAVGAILGEGWYCGALTWNKKRAVYGPAPRLLAQLEIEYTDGRKETMVTDDSWKTAEGPILASDIYDGEIYDQRLELSGWSRADFDDRDWASVKLGEPVKAKRVSSASPRVRKIQEIQPVSLAQPAPGTYVFDLGQNMIGWVRLALPVGLPAGTTVTVRHAEALNPDGTLYTTNLRKARCTEVYTLAGGGATTLEPHFTFHGFRYVELTGLPCEPSLDWVTGVVLHSDTRPTGTFECSNALLNQLQSNITWGQKGNFLEVPTDCPQRDERLGWTGDAQVFIRTACYNMDVAGFFTKWLTDLEDAQSPGGSFPMVAPDVLAERKGDGGAAWAEAGVICPWTIYLCYGDTRILQRHYKSMARYLKFLETVDWGKRHCFGDWLNHNDYTPHDLIGYAFWAYSAAIMAQVAAILGHKEDAAAYRASFKRIKREFIQEFVTPRGRLASTSQTGFILALQFDLLPEALRPIVARRLVEHLHMRRDHLATGFVGTPYLLDVLSEAGELDMAYKLLLNEDYPSWGYPIRQGATTMWERWDSYHHERGFQDAGMNSFNHYAYGAVGDWMYRRIGGIDLDPKQPGYRHVLVRPTPGGELHWAKASLDAPNGTIACDWKRKGDTFQLNVTVPPNSTATVYVPASKASKVSESGKPVAKVAGVELVEFADGLAVYRVGSGRYCFEAQ